nr:GerAB/ArcD/ProY family transporter [Desulforamulus aquiferis]
MVLNKQMISPKQATAFVIAGGVGIIFFWITEASVTVGGRDAWMSYIIGYGLGIPIAFSLIALNKRFPGKTIFQYVPIILGRPLGYFYNLIYIFTFTYFTALILNLSINMISLFYEETPGLVLTGVSVLLIAYVCKHGIEVFGRVCELFIPLILFSIIFMAATLSPTWNCRD